MNTLAWNRILIACLLAVLATAAAADEEQDLIATLQSAASVPQRCAACQKLRIIGTARAVPALAALLGEERTSHAARYALEAMPYAEAGAALRDAAGKTSGPIRAGLIDSLGWRRDRGAVPALTTLLSDVDAMIASAAASALGRIGGPEAVAALSAVRDKAPPDVQLVVFEGLLRGAERLRAEGDGPGAAALYRSLLAQYSPPHFRIVAWRGLVLADASQRSDRIMKALVEADVQARTAAIQLVRELGDPEVIARCRTVWRSLPAEAQLAVLDAHRKQGAEALPTIHAGSESRHVMVRVAAWQALAEFSAPAMIPALVQAAAQGQPAERDAARDTLARMTGAGVREALRDAADKAEAPVKAELLRVFGERGETDAVSVLLSNVTADAEPVRLAALESLRKLAAEDALGPLLDLVGRQPDDAAREPILKAIAAICQASRHKDQATRRVLGAINGVAANQRRPWLPLLSALGTAEALNVALTAAQGQDAELAKEAVRVLADWPNATPAPHLLRLASGSADATLHALAIRGFVKLAAQEPDPAQRVALLTQALAAARRVEEKRLALSQLGQIHTLTALEAVLPCATDPNLVNEASAAAMSIAEKLADAHPQPVVNAAATVLAHCKSAEIVRRAAALRGKPKAGPFLRDWLACGPYSQAGVTGAEKLFPIEFGPEKPEEKVSWQPVPSSDMVNLSGLFGGRNDCVAYLKTHVIVPQDCDALLLLGSDDGVKTWLNGAVVHANNTDRPAVPDQDTAPIKLKAGTNVLLLKITQGQGGWSACARIVSTDGTPFPGLCCEPQPAR
jgi:HEAT repeat protein